MASTKSAKTPRPLISQKTLNQRFLKSVKNQDIAAMREHLVNGADVNAQNRRGIIPLEMTVMSGTAEALALLVEYGADPHHTAHGDRTTLMMAACKGKVEVAQLLLNHGVDLNACDAHYKTAIDIAMEHEHIEMLKFLLPHTNSLLRFATFDKKPPSPKPEPVQLSHPISQRKLNSLFLQAAGQGDYAGVKALLSAGANIEAQDSHGWSALAAAAGNGKVRIAAFLLRNGANPDAQDSWQDTPLMRAVSGGHVLVVQKLLAAGGDPNHSNWFGDKPLHDISIWKSKEVPSREDTLRVLLASGANPNAQDRNGDTLLHMLSSGLSIGVARLLFEAKADPNVKNDNGQTALETIQEHFQEYEGEDYLLKGETLQAREALISLLKEHGAIARLPQKRPETRLDHLQIIFDETPVPKLLKELCKFEEVLRQDGRSLGFVSGFVLLQSSPKENNNCPPNCLPFARARGCQIYFALWHSKKRTSLTKAPVIMYGEDLGSSARVIAEDLQGLLSLLLSVHRASLLQTIEAHPEQLAQVKSNYLNAPSAQKELQQVSQQLRKRFDLKPIRNPVSYLQRCRKKYPDLEERAPEGAE